MFYCTIFVTGVQQNNLGHYLYNFSIFLLHDLWMCVGGSHKFISGKVQRSSLISGWGEQGGSYPEYPHLESINKICIQWTFSLQIKTAYCVSFFFLICLILCPGILYFYHKTDQIWLNCLIHYFHSCGVTVLQNLITTELPCHLMLGTAWM